MKVRSLINNGRYSEAEIILDGYSSSDRGAEWNYLKGQVLMQRGWYFEAQRFFETAAIWLRIISEYLSALDLRQGNVCILQPWIPDIFRKEAVQVLISVLRFSVRTAVVK